MGQDIIRVAGGVLRRLAVEDAFRIILVFIRVYLVSQALESVQDFTGTVQRVWDGALEFGKGVVCIFGSEVEVIAPDFAVETVDIVSRLVRQADNPLLHRMEHLFRGKFRQRRFYVFILVVDIAGLIDRDGCHFLVIEEDAGITGCGWEFEVLCQFAQFTPVPDFVLLGEFGNLGNESRVGFRIIFDGGSISILFHDDSSLASGYRTAFRGLFQDAFILPDGRADIPANLGGLSERISVRAFFHELRDRHHRELAVIEVVGISSEHFTHGLPCGSLIGVWLDALAQDVDEVRCVEELIPVFVHPHLERMDRVKCFIIPFTDLCVVISPEDVSRLHEELFHIVCGKLRICFSFVIGIHPEFQFRLSDG